MKTLSNVFKKENADKNRQPEILQWNVDFET